MNAFLLLSCLMTYFHSRVMSNYYHAHKDVATLFYNFVPWNEAVLLDFNLS